MLGHRLRTSGSELEHSIWASRGGLLQRGRMAPPARAEAKRAGKNCGKDAPWERPSDSPTSLTQPAPARAGGLPTAHEGGGRRPPTLNPKIGCTQKTGHFNLLTTLAAALGV